jgi:hypothetical protein
MKFGRYHGTPLHFHSWKLFPSICAPFSGVKNKKYFLLNPIKSLILNGDSENIDAGLQKKVRNPATRLAGTAAKHDFQNFCIALERGHFAAYLIPWRR